MKKIIFSALLLTGICSLLSFSVAPAGVSFHDTGTFTYSTTFYLCNGDIVDMTLTDNYDYHVVVNNNRAMVNGADVYTGTGIDETTGEVYTLKTTISSHQNVPADVDGNGAVVLRNGFDENIQGDQGGLQKVTVTSRATYNAKGTQTSSGFTIQTNCQ